MTKKRTLTKRKTILLSAVGFLVACCGLLALGSLLPNNATATPTAVVLLNEPDQRQVEVVVPGTDATSVPTVQPTAPPEPSATSTVLPSPTTTPEFRITDPLGNAVVGEMARVTTVIDGDTIEVEIDGQLYRVRYIGMNTPERGQPFFQEATEANSSLVSGQTVILVKDVSETDRYGRLLRYVYLTDGTFVNGELVHLGYAQASAYPPDVTLQQLFTTLQRAAVESGAGLWVSQAAAIAPTIEATSSLEPTSSPTSLPTVPPQPTQQLPSTQPPPTQPPPTQPPPTQPPPTQPPPTQLPPTQPPQATPTSQPETGSEVVIVGVNKRDEYVDVSNNGGANVDLSGWTLVSEKGNQRCPLGGVIAAGQTLRIWALTSDSGQGGFNCGFGSPIWNNSEPDPAVLYNAAGQEVSRW